MPLNKLWAKDERWSYYLSIEIETLPIVLVNITSISSKQKRDL